MKFVRFNYRAVILCESVMMCSAVAAIGLSQQPDFSKCSVEYMRQLVMDSCTRTFRYKRNTNPLTSSIESRGQDDENAILHRFNTRASYLKVVADIPLHLLPVNSTIVVKLRNGRHKKRHVDQQYDYIFHYCCNHMEVCENIDCP